VCKSNPTLLFDVRPNEQISHYFLWECMRPFPDPPVLKLQFAYDDMPQVISLKMPISVSTFIHGQTTDAAGFVSSWKQFAVHETMMTLKSTSIVTVDVINRILSEGLHMSVVPSVDPSPFNICAAGVFYTNTKGRDGNFVNMPCFARVETKENLSVFRMTFRTGHKSVSDALMGAVQLIMGAQPFQAKQR